MVNKNRHKYHINNNKPSPIHSGRLLFGSERGLREHLGQLRTGAPSVSYENMLPHVEFKQPMQYLLSQLMHLRQVPWPVEVQNLHVISAASGAGQTLLWTRMLSGENCSCV